MEKTSFLLVIIIILGVGFGFYQYYVNYQYERDIGSHILNAKDMNTPQRMVSELELAEQGMRNAGLTENTYGAFIFTKPDNSMSFQYQHIDSIIERAKAVEQWRSQVYGNNTLTSETLGDVYEQKMTNLRKFIMEDEKGNSARSDWIAENAWYVKHHLVVYFALLWWMIWGVLVIIILWNITSKSIKSNRLVKSKRRIN